MINSLRNWFGQVTTAHGFMVLAGTLLADVAGSTTLVGSVPFLAAGVLGLVWPERAALGTAGRTVATDVAGMLAGFRKGSGIAPVVTRPPL